MIHWGCGGVCDRVDFGETRTEGTEDDRRDHPIRVTDPRRTRHGGSRRIWGDRSRDGGGGRGGDGRDAHTSHNRTPRTSNDSPDT